MGKLPRIADIMRSSADWSSWAFSAKTTKNYIILLYIVIHFDKDSPGSAFARLLDGWLFDISIVQMLNSE